MNKPSVDDLLAQGLLHKPKQRMVAVVGVELNLLEWGDTDKPGLLFIHGGAAHARWWRFIAPQFLPDFHCVAIDLSGHGDSTRRPFYTSDLWREEVLSLLNTRSVFRNKPVVIGHSMGGLIAIRVAAQVQNLPGLIIIDSAVRAPVTTAVKRRRGHDLLGTRRVYETRLQAQQRFRLIPPQPCENENLLEYIAAESIVQCDDGWTWKYDPQAFRNLQASSIFAELQKITAPTLIIRGQNSRILDEITAAAMKSEIIRAEETVEISDAYHHLILDQPVALIEEIRNVVEKWAV
ncbi:MAG: alpha/beta hydrolase [Gammaproteobacteria bacterium]|nr:alpha/beta hydrolase [Gammaproteobacteria bacterium]